MVHYRRDGPKMVMSQTTDRRRNRLIEQLAVEGIEKEITFHLMECMSLSPGVLMAQRDF